MPDVIAVSIYLKRKNYKSPDKKRFLIYSKYIIIKNICASNSILRAHGIL